MKFISYPVGSVHPSYSKWAGDWEKWRLAYEGGSDFIDKYLERLSDRETDTDFNARKLITYCPRFAGSAVDDVKNAIFQRMVDVKRIEGPASYQNAIAGLGWGVDLLGNTMGSFVGTEIIAELLTMTKVGVLVDMPQQDELGVTQADKENKHPFLSAYPIEDIINWSMDPDGFNVLLLKETEEVTDDLGLPESLVVRYRYMKRIPEGVFVRFYDEQGETLSEQILGVPKIPFTVFELPLSLMSQTAQYQIALMNIESSDVAFAGKSNYPFYYEYYDPKSEPTYLKHAAEPGNTGTADEAIAKEKEVRTGPGQGRRIPKGFDKPGYINPDPDTLRVSMEKGEQLKQDIRLLINLNLSAMNPQRQAAETKAFTESRSLEAGLSHIGLVLEKGEAEIAKFWAEFEGTETPAEIAYPRSYNLLTEAQRLSHAKNYVELSDKIPSDSFRREMNKKLVSILLSGDVTAKDYEKILKEVDETDVLNSDPDVILRATELGLCDDVTASNGLGFDGATVVPQAREDRAKRIALTQKAQEKDAAARGIDPQAGDDPKDEKKGKPGRGEGVKIDKEGDKS
jgi:hypothetical protein